MLYLKKNFIYDVFSGQSSFFEDQHAVDTSLPVAEHPHALVERSNHDLGDFYSHHHYIRDSFDSPTSEFNPQFNRPQTLIFSSPHFSPSLNPSPYSKTGTPSNSECFVKQEQSDYFDLYQDFHQDPVYPTDYHHREELDSDVHFSGIDASGSLPTTNDFLSSSYSVSEHSLTPPADSHPTATYTRFHSQPKFTQMRVAQSTSPSIRSSSSAASKSDPMHFSPQSSSFLFPSNSNAAFITQGNGVPHQKPSPKGSFQLFFCLNKLK